MINTTGVKPKAWGHELIHFSNEHYCLKELVFAKAGNDFSMHFHAKKQEGWLVLRGLFHVEMIQTDDAKVHAFTLSPGERLELYPLTPHKLTALEDDSAIMEVSTADDMLDNYRVAPGMSQRG